MPIVTKSFANTVSFTRASNATYFDSSGLLKRAATNVSRLDYNPSTLAVRGLLVEESRTNLVTYSEDVNNSAWTKTNLTVIPNVVASPAGNISADLIIPNTTGSVDHLILSNVTSVSSGVAYTISVFLKAGGYSWARISFGGVAGGGYAFFNLSTGVVGTVQTTSSASASIENVGNGWYRCTYTRTTTTSGGLNIDLYAQSADNQFGWAGNGTSGIYVWGAQLEAGVFPTSYIPSAITFSGRSSNATYFSSDGLLRNALSGVSRMNYNPSNLSADPFLLLEESRTNLFKYSEHFNDALWFKVDSSIRPDSITSPSGSVSADKLVDTASAIDHYVQCTEIVTTTTSYVFSVFAKAGEKIYIELLMAQGTSPYTNHARSIFNLSSGTIESTALGTASITPVGNGWYRCVVIGTSSSTTEICRISLSNQTTRIYTGNGSDGAYIYGAQLEAGTFPTSYMPSSVTFSGRVSDGTYFDSLGTLQTAISGKERLTYNPSNLSADPFLLLEESRTNHILNNTMTGAVPGTPGTFPTHMSTTAFVTGLTYQIIGAGVEDGISYIDVRWSGTPSSSGFFGIYFDGKPAASVGQTWTSSIYCRLVGGSTSGIPNINIVTAELNSSYVWLTGTSKSFLPTTSPLSVQRQSITRTFSNALVAYAFGGYMDVEVSGSPIDITLRMGMPQMELGAYPTSVIPTSSAAVTRAADTSTSATATRAADTSTSAATTRAADTSIINLNRWFYDTEGTLFVQAIRGFTGNFVNYPHTAGLSDGTSSNRIWAGYGVDASQYITPDIATGGSSQLTYIVGLYSMTSAKNAIAYKNNDSQWAFNGTTSAADTSCLMPSKLNKLSIGSDHVGGQCWNGWIRSIKYYPRRLTQAELQALTT